MKPLCLMMPLLLLLTACGDGGFFTDGYQNTVNDVEGSYDRSSRCMRLSWDEWDWLRDDDERFADEKDEYYTIQRQCYGDCDGIDLLFEASSRSPYINCYNDSGKASFSTQSPLTNGTFRLQYTIYAEKIHDETISHSRVLVGDYETPKIKRDSVVE